jgi:hypothetical protein
MGASMTDLTSLLGSNLGMAAVAGLVSLVAVWLPFQRGVKLSLQALGATRPVRGADLRRAVSGGGGGSEPLALLLLQVLRRSLQEEASAGLPREFVIDASKQYVHNEFEAHYARPISMYANLLPPIGFIGTTVGLLVLFLSLHLSNEALELGALATALLSSIFALIGFAALEGMKVRLYGRLLRCLDEALAVVRSAEKGGEEARRARASQPA